MDSRWTTPASAQNHRGNRASGQQQQQQQQQQAKPQSIFDPIYAKMETMDYVSTQTLKEAFHKVEKHCPGFSQDFTIGLLYRVGVNNEADVWETSLRIGGLNDNYVQHPHRRQSIADIESRAMTLKGILSTIPDEITDRRSFIGLIKEVASAIKELLNRLMPFCDSLPPGGTRRALEEQKKQFVIYCRKFSATLKEYFRDNSQKTVFNSANRLVTQINLILLLMREME